MRRLPSADPTLPPPDDGVTPVEDAPASSRDPLALSIGHDINNPLAALLTNLSLAVDLLRDEGQEPRARTEALELLEDVRQAAERIRAVVQRLRGTAPSTRPPLPLQGVAPSQVDASTGASGPPARVLVVDDDEMVGNALQRGLRDQDVVKLTNAEEALARVVSGERFSVIVCDLMMPEMTGMDLHEELLKIAPDQAERMVFITGGAVTTRARDFVATVGNLVLDKPFDMRALRKMIRRRIGAEQR